MEKRGSKMDVYNMMRRRMLRMEKSNSAYLGYEAVISDAKINFIK